MLHMLSVGNFVVCSKLAEEAFLLENSKCTYSVISMVMKKNFLKKYDLSHNLKESNNLN